MSLVPQTYEEWKHCITVKCGIALTPHYARERIAALADKKDFHTQKFIECWGATIMAKRSPGFDGQKQNFDKHRMTRPRYPDSRIADACC